MQRSLKTFYVILDFEATCCEFEHILNQEIIQFPSVIVDGDSLEIISKFDSYVRPKISPNLTPFCTKLTGIQQKDVDSAMSFPQVLAQWRTWLLKNTPLEYNCVFVTWGDWDLMYMLHAQCSISKISPPKELLQWFNLKYLINSVHGVHPKVSLHDVVQHYGMHPVGSAHNGLDDCLNIAKILVSVVPRVDPAYISQRYFSERGRSKWESIQKEWIISKK